MDLKREAARKAVGIIKNETTVGLGAGATMKYMVEFLKTEIEAGLGIKVLTSSFSTRKLLELHNFPLLSAGAMAHLDIYFDGCDQFDRDLNALKSGGGIHTSEKILAVMAEQFVIVGDESKSVESFDSRFPLVIEVMPEALSFATAKVQVIFPGTTPRLRMSSHKDGAVVTENGNYLIDIWFEEWPELAQINPALKEIPGIIETSLFYNIAKKAVIAGVDGVRILEKQSIVE